MTSNGYPIDKTLPDGRYVAVMPLFGDRGRIIEAATAQLFYERGW